ncbi:MAG TPA: acyltransferase family protein [Spirochaetota bacterium]|nr:acyltransferase family protein [Spirochaetota bacterium]
MTLPTLFDFGRDFLGGNFYVYMLAFFLLPVSVLYGAKFFKPGEYNDGYLSRDITGCVKGISIFVVILHHLSQRISGAGMFFSFTRYGYLAVSIFFFLSGYSLMVSLLKSPAYLDNFLRKRLSRVYIPVLVINSITLASYHLIYGFNWTITGIVKNITGIELIDQILWFVNAILIFYVVFFIAFRFFSVRTGVFIVLAYSFVYYNVCKHTGFGEWWYNTSFCFPLGVMVAYKYKVFTGFMQRNYMAVTAAVVAVFCASFYLGNWWPYPVNTRVFLIISAVSCVFMAVVFSRQRNYTALVSTLVIGTAAYFYIWRFWYFPAYASQLSVVSSISCVFMMLVFLMKVNVGNRLWVFMGVISYEMYLVHMKLFNIYFSYVKLNSAVTIYIFLAIVIAAAWVFNKLFDYINQPQKAAAPAVSPAGPVDVETEPEA